MPFYEYEHWMMTDSYAEEIIAWCQKNVGNVLWSQPVIQWHGDGWHISRSGYISGSLHYRVSFENPEMALLAQLTLTGSKCPIA